MVAGSLTWTIEMVPGGQRVILAGRVDETSDLDRLQSLRGVVTLDLAGVTRFNSVGVFRWVSFLGGLGDVTTLTFERCSVAFVAQMNMMPGLLGSGHVRSFYVPLSCLKCSTEHSQEELVEVTPELKLRGWKALQFNCGVCTAVLSLDDIPERYFAFLSDRGSGSEREAE